jgi:hypothetical protein
MNLKETGRNYKARSFIICTLSVTVRMVTSRTMSWTDIVACMGKIQFISSATNSWLDPSYVIILLVRYGITGG